MDSVVNSLTASKLIADTKKDAQTELASIEERGPEMNAIHEKASAVWRVARAKLREVYSSCRTNLGDDKKVRASEACTSIGYGSNISDIGDEGCCSLTCTAFSALCWLFLFSLHNLVCLRNLLSPHSSYTLSTLQLLSMYPLLSMPSLCSLCSPCSPCSVYGWEPEMRCLHRAGGAVCEHGAAPNQPRAIQIFCHQTGERTSS